MTSPVSGSLNTGLVIFSKILCLVFLSTSISPNTLLSVKIEVFRASACCLLSFLKAFSCSLAFLILLSFYSWKNSLFLIKASLASSISVPPLRDFCTSLVALSLL